ncbi:hypothetical protein KIH39_22705 [Telmatocola sphagniphila]|uniref:Apea-like HEPN domain-containing protein n=1 Tax=Telmatocola sphagniphila TaxID=1123043 RepID=A0A8E6B742_9BACT|nr:hypothetical protein [Telmatocola sphagniphila]QVL31625.1 hypothetical protein KIH39_22705 [Telmatocola sphagniphila]
MEIALLAMRLPGISILIPTIHDMGVSAGLWVSAFEILAYDGKWAGPKQVKAMIGQGPWLTDQSRAIAVDLYEALYAARNAFMHGNEVTLADLHLGGQTQQSVMLPMIAPLIFRNALLGILGFIVPPRLDEVADQWLPYYWNQEPFERAMTNALTLVAQSVAELQRLNGDLEVLSEQSQDEASQMD